jgi:hypothetical protein
MKLNIAIVIISFFSLITTAKAQTPLPYYSGFDNASQKNGWQLFRKGDVGLYKWEYSLTGFSGDSCVYHGYPVGGTTVTDDWFVSPGFIITQGGVLDSVRHAFSGFGNPAVADTLALYLLVGNADPALATSRQLLHDFRGTNYTNDDTWRLTSNIALPASTAPCYFAIRYKTINNWLTVKFDNVRIRGNATTAIKPTNMEMNVFQVTPNPAKDMLTIDTKEQMSEISITDVSGRIVYRKPFSKSISLLQFKNGVYHLTGITTSGALISRTFVKN